MRILVTGGTGFIGRNLCRRLKNHGHLLTILTRNPKKAQKRLALDTDYIDNLTQINPADRFDAIINLAGEPIATKRWTPQRKKLLENSRLETTAALIGLIKQLEIKPKVLISGSAVGYYGNCGDRILTEFSEPQDEFSHRLCAAWEMQALRAKSSNVRVCIIRTGLVVGKDGGFLEKMLPAFKLGLGTKFGDGKQWMSWIHIEDMINIILFLLNDESKEGIFNATAPNPVTNTLFSNMLASVLHRPRFLTIPEALLNFFFGEMSQLLVTGQRVVPTRLEKAGFEFKFKALRPALIEACGKSSQ